jgi:heat-inducible transcriptional repressor
VGLDRAGRDLAGLNSAGLDSAGLDEASQAMRNLVLIGAPARLGGANLGTVAVIAPTRIQYQEMIQAVRYIARLSERLLEDSAG